ncbi:MAG: DUF4911 domain-containing protein [Pseudomonadota bacterium]
MDSVRRYFRLPKTQIAYVRFITEAYDGLVQVKSLPGRGEIEWIIPESQLEQAEALIRALEKEVGLVDIEKPDDWP